MLMPTAATTDTRLTARHYRLLAAIAWHDRGGANGRGCTASQSTLARWAQVQRPAVTKLLRELIEWGHVAVIVDGGQGRKSEICVVYRDPTGIEYGASSEAEHVLRTVHVDSANGTVSAASEAGSYILREAPSAVADVLPTRWEGRERRVLAIPEDGGFIREAERLWKDGEVSDGEAWAEVISRLQDIADTGWQTDRVAGWAYRVLEDIEYSIN